MYLDLGNAPRAGQADVAVSHVEQVTVPGEGSVALRLVLVPVQGKCPVNVRLSFEEAHALAGELLRAAAEGQQDYL